MTKNRRFASPKIVERNYGFAILLRGKVIFKSRDYDGIDAFMTGWRDEEAKHSA